jgi:DNA polymerase
MAARKRVTPEQRSADARKAARRPAEPVEQAGMEESPAPGAATADAAESGKAPAGRAGGTSAAIPGIDAPAGLSVGDANVGLFGSPFAKLDSLAAVAKAAAECTRCPLYASATNAVPGEGNPDADLVCVGEAPGENEDREGRPFIGASGQLLTKILAAIKLAREDVFIANVLKHRPPGNRNPRPDEVEACSPYLVRQLELIRPKVILCFGTFAAQTLLNTKTPIGKLRGAVHRYYGTPLVVTYHPAALLRNPTWKRPTWEDVQLARRILDRAADA